MKVALLRTQILVGLVTTMMAHMHILVFFRDATDSTFKFFDGYTPEPGQAIDVTHASYNDADIKFGTAFGDITGNVTGDLTGNVTGEPYR